MSSDGIKLFVKRLDPDVELPSYAYAGDAGLDLRANEDVTLAPHERRLIATGLAVAIPEGYAGFVQPRSGMALKRGLSMANTAVNLDNENPIQIERGERIAQLVIQKVPVVTLIEVDELDETDRGAGGFGSGGA